MRSLVLLIVFISFAQAQTPLGNLKKTLSEAEKKYGLIYTYDDLFISKHLALETPLPHKIDDFLQILGQAYNFHITKREDNIILSSNRQYQNNTLCGYVKSQRFDYGIQNVLIVVEKQFTTTDSLGYFSFNHLPNQKGKLQFKTTQYGDKSFDYQITTDCEAYYIDDDEIKLGEVILEYIVPPIKKRSNGSYEINLTQLPTAPGSVNPDIVELLQLLPGVSNPNENSTIFIRGGTPDQNKIHWNNIRVYQNHHANGGLSPFNPFSIDKIELIVKGVPANYGEQTSGMVLLKNKSRSGKTGLRASAGANLLDTDFVMKYKSPKKSYLNFSARSSFKNLLSQSFKDNTFNRFAESNEQTTTFEDQEIYYNDLTLSSGLTLNKFSILDFYTFYLEDRIDYELYNADIEFRDHLDSENWGLGMKYSYSRNQRIWDFNLSHSAFEMMYSRFLEEYPQGGEENENEAEYKGMSYRANQVKETNVSLTRKISNHSNYFFSWGVEYLYRKVDFNNQPDLNRPEYVILQMANENNFSSFGILKSNFSDRYLMELGLRHNYFHSVKSHRLEPRLNLTQYLHPKWRLQTTFESKSQSIFRSNETINNSTDKTNNLWIGLGNAHYPLLKSNQFSLGAMHKSKTVIIEWDGYRKWFDGVTTFGFGYLDPNDQDHHLGKSNILGFDFFFQKKWNNTNFWLSYTHQRNKNKFSDVLKGRSFNSNFFVQNQLNLGYNINLSHWHFHINFNLRSGIPYSIPDEIVKTDNGNTFVYNELNNYLLPTYQRLDFSLSKRFLISKSVKMDFKMALKNLTQDQNILERIHYYDANSESIKKIDHHAMIRFANVGLRLYFN
ncbi:MAG: TonB-dependent receptor [Flavobacteriaceae bacterium]|nr:TonB-dependent receptor [Flavobacteriaceae bacterium]